MSKRDDLVRWAAAQVGKPYETYRDCSGFTAAAFRQVGITIPEGSVAQYGLGAPIALIDYQPGDLLFWDTFGPAPGHVAIYVGGGHVIHALNKRRGIVRSMWDSDMGGPFMGARRVLKEEANPVTDPWRPLPYPPMRMSIVRKPGEGAGFNRVTFRGPRIVGSCNHITDGDPGGDTIQWYTNFFSTGGERQWDALTDVIIARDGEIGCINDWRDPNRGGTRAGWANGTTDGLEGDGVAFYRNYPDINDVLVSKEHVARSGQSITDAMLQSSIALSAAVAQEVRCPYDTYPYHPGKRGVNIEQMHRNFAPKTCPAEPFASKVYPVLVREVRAILTKHQTGSTNPAEPPAPPPVVEPKYPFGFPREAIDYFWGELNIYDGRVAPFDPKGPLSLLWLKRCEAEGRFPEAETWVNFGGRDIVTWEGGWTAIREPGQNASWTWLDKGAPSPTMLREEG